ncbi:SRPBCC domain-containing protein [Bowmanella sp. Y26]|uniref:SRPBCC domain-containing protein n=1 Tax=Bowmanella yangjiangensis TaxID=2811230 RepID=UPI001BDDB5A7|nr:SRPBCC domain-containing protein [Bowmanella yangjiangensis]MBT1063066.1 SRPBCC domain-containing protein [Bowmanella yangjiangensis]
MSKIDSINRALKFNVPIERVWAAISDPTQVSCWFGSKAEYQLETGSVGWFEWPPEICAGRYAMRIEQVDAPHYLAWRWMAEPDLPFNEATSTLVEWWLEEAEQRTQLKLKESGFLSHKQQQMNVQGWQQELDELESFLLN